MTNKIVLLDQIMKKSGLGYVLIAEHEKNSAVFKIKSADCEDHPNKSNYRLAMKSIYHGEWGSEKHWLNLTEIELKRLIKGRSIKYLGHGHLGFADWESLMLKLTNKGYIEYLL
jgi:hypothetical protein